MNAAALLAAALLAATSPAPAATAAAPRPTPRPSATQAAPASRSITGEVLAVDAASRRIVVREAFRSTRGGTSQVKREVVTLLVDAATRIEKAKKPLPLEGVAIGDHVSARYTLLPAPTPGPGPARTPHPETAGVTARALIVRVADAAPRPTPGAAPTPIPERPPARKAER